jgi:hypothetical protein
MQRNEVEGITAHSCGRQFSSHERFQGIGPINLKHADGVEDWRPRRLPYLNQPEPPSIPVKQPAILPESHVARLAHVVDQSWIILKSRFLSGRNPIQLEAPFQHYFAHVLASYGQLCCVERRDQFLVDLERRMPGNAAGREYLDMCCSFAGTDASCAIELKFKTNRQGAQDHGRIDAYQDLDALERACQSEFSFGRFFMITDSTPYIRKSKHGVGTVFATHDGHHAVSGAAVHYPSSKGRENVKLTLRNSYVFSWEKVGEWYFLEMHVPRPPCAREPKSSPA